MRAQQNLDRTMPFGWVYVVCCIDVYLHESMFVCLCV